VPVHESARSSSVTITDARQDIQVFLMVSETVVVERDYRQLLERVQLDQRLDDLGKDSVSGEVGDGAVETHVGTVKHLVVVATELLLGLVQNLLEFGDLGPVGVPCGHIGQVRLDEQSGIQQFQQRPGLYLVVAWVGQHDALPTAAHVHARSMLYLYDAICLQTA
jgi:hypothetical protein